MTPARLPLRLLEATLGRAVADAIVGDLVEEWRERCAVDGRRRADAWLWLQAVSVAARLRIAAARGDRRTNPHEREGVGMIEMLRNDVRYGVRMLAKAPAFTAVADSVAICNVTEPVGDPNPMQRGRARMNVQNNLIRSFGEVSATAMLGIDAGDVGASFGTRLGRTNAFDPAAVGGANGRFCSQIDPLWGTPQPRTTAGGVAISSAADERHNKAVRSAAAPRRQRPWLSRLQTILDILVVP